MKRIYQLYKEFYRRNFVLLIAYLLCTLAYKVLCFVLPIMTEKVIDIAVSQDMHAFLSAATVFLVSTVVCGCLLAARYWTKDIAENRAVTLEKEAILKDMFSIPYENLMSNTVGNYIQLLTDDVEKSKGLILYDIPVFVCNAIFSICMVVYLWVTDIPLALIVIGFVPLFTLITRVMLPKIEQINKKVIEHEERVKDMVDEVYTGNLTVRAANAQLFYHKRIHEVLAALFKAKSRAINLDIIYDLLLVTGIMSIANAAIYVLGGVRVIQGAITIGTVTSFTLYFSSLWTSVDGFMAFFKEYQVKMISIDRLVALHSQKERKQYSVESLPEFEHLKIDDLSFSYASTPVLSKLCISIHKGERVLIMGANGSGKSTLAHLFIKLLSPQQGSIHYNHIDYADIDPVALRSKVLYVPAESFVISGSKEDNLWGHDSDELSVFDDRMISMTAYSESAMSSGERKQLQLSRALSQNAEVYILDEPFNFIDMEAKQKLWNYIKHQFEHKTLIIISHDHFMKDECDRIFSL